MLLCSQLVDYFFYQSKNLRPLSSTEAKISITNIGFLSFGALLVIGLSNLSSLSQIEALKKLEGLDATAQAETFERLGRLDKKFNHWILVKSAKAQEKLGDLKSAQTLYEQVGKNTAAYPDAWFGICRIKAQLEPKTLTGSELSQLETLIRSAKRNELMPELQLLKAKRAEKSGDLKRASTLYRKLAKDYPTSPLFNLAFEKLESFTNSKLRDLPNTLDSVDLLLKAKKTKRAYDYLEKAKLITDGNSAASIEILVKEEKILRSLKKTEEANNVLKQIIGAGTEGSADVAMLKAVHIDWNKNEHLKALDQINGLQKRFPNSRLMNEVLYVEGRILEEIKSLVEAKEKYFSVVNNIGKKYSGKYSGATNLDKRYYLKSLKRLAWLYFRNKHPKKSKEMFSKLKVAAFKLKNFELHHHAAYWEQQNLENLEVVSDVQKPLSSKLGYYSLINSNNSLENSLLSKDSFKGSCENTIEPDLLERLTTLGNEGLNDLSYHEVNWHLARKLPSLNRSITREKLSAYATTSKAFSISGNPSNALRLAGLALRKIGPRSNSSVARCKALLTELYYPMPFLDEYRQASQHFGVPLPLLFGLSRTESHFNRFARSPVGAQGLMQLMPKTARQEGLKVGEDIFSSEVNIRLGTKHLSGLIKEYGDQEVFAIASYNAGKNAVNRWLSRHPELGPAQWTELISYPETNGYVKKVTAAKKVYEVLLKRIEIAKRNA